MPPGPEILADTRLDPCLHGIAASDGVAPSGVQLPNQLVSMFKIADRNHKLSTASPGILVLLSKSVSNAVQKL